MNKNIPEGSNQGARSGHSLRIAFHADGATAGGLRQFIRHLVSSFTQRGHQVIIFVNNPGPFSEEMSRTCEVYCFDQAGQEFPGFKLGPVRIPNPVVAVRNFWSTAKNRKHVAAVIKDARPDVIVGRELTSAMILGKPCRRLGIPLIICIHGIGRRGNDFMNLRARISARFFNGTDLLVGVSQACLQRYLPYLNIHSQTIYNCCPPVVTQSLKPDFLTDHRLPPDTTLIGSFGRIQFDKGYHVLLKAMAQLSDATPPTALVIGGKPLNEIESKQLIALQQLAAELKLEGRCFFIGETTPEHFFSIIDIFCHTYLGEENLSYAILEAMSANCPIIAVDRGGPREMINAPRGGQLIAPNDPLLLADAIKRYLADPDGARAAAANSRQQLNEKFNFQEWPTNWLATIQSCHSSRNSLN